MGVWECIAIFWTLSDPPGPHGLNIGQSVNILVISKKKTFCDKSVSQNLKNYIPFVSWKIIFSRGNLPKKGPNPQQIDTKGFSLDSGSIDPAE